MEKILKEKLKGGKFSNVSSTRSKTMSSIKGKGNKSTELKFRMALVRAGVSDWVLHDKTIIGTPDFYFPKSKLAVFIDGCFWHGCPKCGHIPKTNPEFWETKIERNRKKDRSVTRKLRYRKYKVIRIWEHELRKNMDLMITKIKRSVDL